MIGAYTAERIARDTSEKVVLFDLNPIANEDLPRTAKAIRGDVTDPFQLADVIRRELVTRIIHLAGVLANALNAMPYRSIGINVGGLVNVLEAARVFGLARVVFASTAMAYDFRGSLCEPDYRGHAALSDHALRARPNWRANISG